MISMFYYKRRAGLSNTVYNVKFSLHVILYLQADSIRGFSGKASRVAKPLYSINGNDYGWFSFYSLVDYDIVSPTCLKTELERFFLYYTSNHKVKYFAIIFKIKFPNGEVRSCSTTQVSHLGDFNNLYSILSYIYTFEDFSVKVSEDHNKEDLFVDNLPKGNIVFYFKPLSTIKNTKYEKLIPARDKYNDHKAREGKDFIQDFIYKNFAIPAHMDLSIWPNISFSNDYNNAHAFFNVKLDNNQFYVLDFIFSINSTSYNVTVRNREKIIFTFQDESTSNNRDLTLFKRTIIENGIEKLYIFDSGKVVFYTIPKKSTYISKVSKDLVNLDKPKILTLDLETRVIKDLMIPLCMSIFDGKNAYSTTFNQDSWQNDMIAGLKVIMKRKYDTYKIYVHNFSYFDGIFMIDVLSMLGEVKPFMRDNQILKLVFKFKTDKGRYCTLYFYDSMLLFHDSLDNLSKSFSIKNKKMYFPLMFLNKADFSIKYKGPVPEYKYFPKAFTNGFSIYDYKKYCEIYKTKEWKLCEELIKYCEGDTIALYQILIKFQTEIYKIFLIDITKYPTLASITFAIYRSNFLNSNYLIPNILSKIHFSIKQSYYGGVTEAYKGFGKNIKSYDINSLYPHSMKTFPMPVGEPIYFSGNVKKYLKDPFGFFKVKVYAPDTINKPFLPIKIETVSGKRTIFPVGTWEGWYFSEEIKNAEKYGYKFDIIEGYLFKKNFIFSEYIDVLYKMKVDVDPSDPKYYIAKLLMNSLYGRFGLNPVFDVVKIVSSLKSEKIISKHTNVNIIPLLSGNVIVTYPKSTEDGININNISVPISSAIAAYSRITMSYYMMKYSKDLYAIDTDGIKLGRKLPGEEVDSKKLGKFKYEFTFKEAVFPAPKVYGGLLEKPYKKYTKELVKIKGLKNPIPYFIFKPLQNKNTVLKIDQEKWRRDVSKSTILVTSEPYTLAITEYKRELVYDSLGNFVDSIPLYLKNGIIVKRNPPLLYYLPLGSATASENLYTDEKI